MNVTFKSVSKSYGIINALKEASFEVSDGEFVFIVGPSGAGKSTLLKLILHQTIPTSGEILIDGANLKKVKKNRIDSIRRNIGVIFQDYQLIPDKTVEENIALGLDIVNYPTHQIQSKIDEVLDQVNLISRRFLFPSQLSGGELQRTSLARALAIDPKLILADEPTGNLDVENSWNLIKLLKDINESRHTSIIMTTHNLDIVESLGKRIIYLRDGRICPKITVSPEPPKNQKVKKSKTR